MRDGPLRRALKAVARWKYGVDLAVTRRLRPPRYELRGACLACARCCETPTIQPPWYVWHLRPFRWLFLAWQTRVNGFELLRLDAERHLLVFRCTHFDAETRRCDSYESRPGLCRDYPRNLLHQPWPEFFEACGYRPVAPNAEAMLAALRKRDLSEEQLAELKRKMFLE